MMRFLVADDHAIIRKGIRSVLEGRYPFCSVDDTPSIDGILTCAGAFRYDLALLELILGDGNLFDHIEAVMGALKGTPLLIVSMAPEHLFFRRAISVGCAGFLSKNAEETEVLRAVAQVLRGEMYMSAEQRSILQLHKEAHDPRQDPFSSLSARELAVMYEISKGLGIKEIADRLALSPSTVATYKARSFDKLGITSVIELGRLLDAHDTGPG